MPYYYRALVLSGAYPELLVGPVAYEYPAIGSFKLRYLKGERNMFFI